MERQAIDIRERLRKEASRQIRAIFRGAEKVSIRHTDGGTLGAATYPGGIRDYIYVKHGGLRIGGRNCTLSVIEEGREAAL